MTSKSRDSIKSELTHLAEASRAKNKHYPKKMKLLVREALQNEYSELEIAKWCGVRVSNIRRWNQNKIPIRKLEIVKDASPENQLDCPTDSVSIVFPNGVVIKLKSLSNVSVSWLRQIIGSQEGNTPC